MKTVRLIYDAETRSFNPTPRVSSKRGQFIPPVPADWYKVAAGLPGKALAVAGLIRLEAARRRDQQISLTNRLTDSFGIHRDAKRRALIALEKAGLIQLDRRSGKNPKVTVTELS